MASNKTNLPRFISRPIIRHAFEGALNSCARLNNFATGSSTGIGDELVDFRAQKLALDDLTSFALHARRLIQTTGTRALISKVAILGARNWEKEQLPVVEVISTIVHGDDVHIIRTDFDAVILHSGDPLGVLAKFVGKKPTDVSRVILTLLRLRSRSPSNC